MSVSQLVAIAAEQVGAREVGGNNKGATVREYQGATWLQPDAWAWCAAFICWVIREWLQLPEGVAYCTAHGITNVEAWRCKDASAFGFIKWAKTQNLVIFDERDPKLRPRAGDLIVYNFSHIGIVENGAYVNGQYGPTIKTIEGNTHVEANSRDSEAGGDGVWRMQRPVSLVRAYIRLEP